MLQYYNKYGSIIVYNARKTVIFLGAYHGLSLY